MKKSIVSFVISVAMSLFAFGAFAACPAGLDGLGLTIWLDTTDIDGKGDDNPAENTAVNGRHISRADKGGIVDLGCYENSTFGGTILLLR